MTQPEKRPFDSLLAEPATLDSAGQEQQAAPAQTESQTRTRAQEQEAADQAKVKRTRIRQACDRCKSRKTKVCRTLYSHSVLSVSPVLIV